MKEKKSKKYSLVRVANKELFLDSQLMSAGANPSRLLEKYEKNPDSLKHMSFFTKVVFALMMAFLTIMPIITYIQIMEQLSTGTITVEIIIFIGSLLFGIFFAMQFGYLLMAGMLFSSALMSGESFKWLETLPISPAQLEKMGFKLILWSVNVIIIVILSVFPIVMLFISMNLIVFILCIFVSFVNVFFFVSIIVHLGHRLYSVLKDTEAQTAKKTVIRLLYMGSYIIMMFGIIFALNWAMSSIGDLFYFFATSEHPAIINFILSLIPFPFAPAYFIMLLSVPSQVPIELWFTTIIGFTLFLLLTWRIFKSALRALRDVSSPEADLTKRALKISVEDIQAEFTTTTPVKSYLRKDLLTATRDLQMLMFLIMPIIFPLIMIFTTLGFGSSDPLEAQVAQFIIFLLIFSPMMVGMLTAGLLNVEESGATILASLPVVPRDQAKAKLILILSFLTIAFTSPTVPFITHPDFIVFLGLTLSMLPIGWCLGLLMFAMKIRFFGKMKYKYVLEEINIEYKIVKWIIMVVVEIGILIGTIFLSFQLFVFGLVIMELVLLMVGLAGLGSLYITITKMFPK